MSALEALPNSPSVARNRDAILHVLRIEFAACRRVLEIGSGTGEHAIYFAAEMPDLHWQCSDRPVNHAAIESWLTHAGLKNVASPLTLDVDDPPPFDGDYDGVFSANTAHIMSETQVAAMFEVAGRALGPTGRFCLYGPFKRNGEFTSPSNERFDASLKAQQPHMGIRALETMDEFAQRAAMSRRALYAMPANNFIAVWQRRAAGTDSELGI